MIARALLVWFAMLVLAIANGAFREWLLLPHLGEVIAHIVSTIMLGGLILLLSFLTIRWIDPRSSRAAIGIGVFWLVLTLLFEFSFGRAVAHKSWSELWAAYDLLHGRVWLLIPIVTMLAPWWTTRWRKRS